MSEENHTVEQHNRSRWTGDEMDRLKQVYTDTPPMDTKGDSGRRWPAGSMIIVAGSPCGTGWNCRPNW